MSVANCWNLRVTAEVNQGGRRYMEDVTSVQFERAKGDKKIIEYAAFAVFDGHGGKEAAHFARDHILENIKNQKGFFSKDTDAVKKAIKDGFLLTHHQMWNELPKWPKTYNGHPSTAGTTASLVLIRGNKMYVANVGDSMVVMGTRVHRYRDNQRAFQAMELTVDHKPELPEERKRIEHCGGCVMNKAGVNRVVWNRPKLSHSGPIRRSTKLDRIPFLAIARSLGDLWSFNSEKNEFIVSPVPDVHVYDLVDGREQFIVLASDGLWNMVRPYESVTSAGTFDERKRKKEVSGTPAHELVQLALDRWRMRAMRADNTSVIVVYIERKKMEPAFKKRDTYSESWTSARLEGSKFKDDNMPFQNADKLSDAGTSSDSEDANKKEEELASSSNAPSNSNAIPTTSSNIVEKSGTGSSSADSEPVQDNSVSSSSGDSEKVISPRSSPKGELANRSTKRDPVIDEPTSSIANGQEKTESEEETTTPGRRMTRKLSREIEVSQRRTTRSSMKKEDAKEFAEKKSLKRRKSAESLPSLSRERAQGPSLHKRSRTEFKTMNACSKQTTAIKSVSSTVKTRPKSLERCSVKSSTKIQTKSVSAKRSRSEPSLAVAKKTSRVRRTPVKHGK